MSVVYINSYQFATTGPTLTTWDIGITTSDGNWSLRTASTCNYDVDWGDGQTDTNVSATGTFVQSHTYASSGSYTVKVTLNSGVFRPRFDYTTGSSNTEVVSLGATPTGWSFGTDLSQAFYTLSSLSSVSASMDTSAVTNYFFAWYGCANLASFPLLDTSGGTSFVGTWQGCTSLTSFPLITASSGTDFTATWQNCTGLTSFPLIDVSSGTNFSTTWRSCTSLTSFPLLDTSSGTNFASAWRNCSGLTSFPLLNVSSGTSFAGTWQDCTSLTSFPALNMSSATAVNSAWLNCTGLTSFSLLGTNSVTNFGFAWFGCSNLVNFPANFFDNWTATPGNNCFYYTWYGCTSLSATSVENILNSIATSGRSPSAAGTSATITIDYNASSGTPSISSAVSTLKSRGWIIVLNGVTQ